MELLKFGLLTHLFLYSRIIGVFPLDSSSRWPLDDCHSQNIDLVFVPDPVFFLNSKLQIALFSSLVDVFSPKTETTLNRLRVSLVIPSNNSIANSVLIDTKITFGAHKDKKSLKDALNEIQYPDDTRPNITEGTRAIIQAVFNSTDYETRPETIQAIIMVTHVTDSEDSVKNELSQAYFMAQQMTIWIFFVIIKRESSTDMEMFVPYDTHVVLENLDSIGQKHNIPIRLCKMCFSDWFNVIKVVPKDLTNVSCYKLGDSTKNLHWIDANEQCKKEVSELASIETATEHNLLEDVLPNHINFSQSTLNSTSAILYVYIGLRRRLSSMGQRFRWVNQMPLVHSQWRHSQPLGGNTISCAVWEFPLEEIVSGRLIKESTNETSISIQLSSSQSNGWSTVGCGNVASPFYLCEIKSPISRYELRFKDVHLPEPKSESMTSAIGRGELGINWDLTRSLFLASVLLLHKDIYKKSFAYFNHNPEKYFQINDVNMFYCDNFTQIPYSMVCDHVTNCTNEADEVRCSYSYRKCDENTQFSCNNKQCVPTAARCDMYKDCLDGSDEEDCIACPLGRCQTARCMPKHWFLDGEIDCSSCTSESLAEEATFVELSENEECVFICNRTECVDISMLNDSDVQCQGPEGKLDETIGAMESTLCYSDSDNVTTAYTNWAPRCIYIKDRYGEPLGCRNMKHLTNCSNFVCPEGFFKCPDSYCIPNHYLKNSEYECANGEDEGDFNLVCYKHFRCAMSSICLHPDHVCDGQVDCPRGDDETNCHITCGDGFLCFAGTVTARGYNKDVPLTNLDFVTPSTRYLDLSGINVSAVFPEFPPGRLINVLNLSLSGCSITTLDATRNVTPSDLRGVWWIDLSYNLIQKLSNLNIIKYVSALQFLNLSHNEHLIEMDAFPFRTSSSYLKVVDLSYTSVSSMKASLINLKNLEKLILRNTRIFDIPNSMFPADFTLQVLDLRGLTLNELYPKMFKNVTITMFLLTDSFKLCCPQLHDDDTDIKVCVSAKDPFSSCSDLMSKLILRILLWVSGVLAIVGNVTVIIYRLFFDKLSFRMAYGHYIMHLSFSDLFMGVYLIVIATADVYYRDTYVWDEYDWRKSPACKVAGFLSMLSSETSTAFIFLITLDRFFALRLPFRQLKSSRKLITLACTLTWALGFMVAYIPLLPGFEDWKLYSSNAMCLALPLTNRRLPGWQFSTAIFIFLNFFLFILIAVGQLAIYRSVFAMRINQSKLSNASCRRAQDLAIAKNLFLVVVTDFMCWFPIGIMGILAMFGYETGPETYAWMAVIVLPVNSAINPVLYTVPVVIRKLRQYKDDVLSHRSKSH